MRQILTVMIFGGFLAFIIISSIFLNRFEKHNEELLINQKELTQVLIDIHSKSEYDYQIELKDDSAYIFNTNTEMDFACPADSIQIYLERDNE